MEPARAKARHARTRRVRTLLVFFFVALLIWVGVFAVAALQLSGHVLDAKQELSEVQASLEAFDVRSAQEHVVLAQDSLTQAKRFSFVIQTGGWIPVVGDSLSGFAKVIRSSEAFIDATTPLIELGIDLIQLSGLTDTHFSQWQLGSDPDITFADLSVETKRAVLQRLSASSDELHLLVAQMDILEEELGLLRRSAQVGPMLPVLDSLAADLAGMREPILWLSRASTLLPAFGGLEDPSNILVLLLNNNELRPGGGFIGSYGVLVTDGGDIASLETVDVYALDDAVEDRVDLLPPSALGRYNATSTWLFRDSNWSPDFSVSAAQSVQMYLAEAALLEPDQDVPVHEDVDHVIGLTPTFASALLEITGPITVGGQTFTSQNVADLLEYQVQFAFAQNGIPLSQRKDILADLVQEMKDRLFALPASEWVQVLASAQTALTQKQIMLYSVDSQVQSLIERVGWGGVVSAPTTDVLMVVDANLASLKSDPAVEREVTYELFRNSSAQWIGRVSITYTHTGTFDWKTTRYRTYTRVYAPEGSQFLGVQGSWLNDITQNPTRAKGPVDVVEELGMVSFGTFTSVEPGQQNTLVVEYVLSPDVVSAIGSGTYGLTVIKQPGAQNNPLTLDLDFDKNVTHATPAEASGEWGDDQYRLQTVIDQDLRIFVDL